MRPTVVTGLVLAFGVAAAGCADNKPGGRADSRVCTPFATQGPASTDPTAVAAAPGGDAAAFDDCLHRWGYRLAKAEGDPADVVARAVMAACTPVLSRWNQTTLNAQPPGTSDTAVSLVTGQAGNTPADRYGMGQAKALFYVVQARAGNCAAPN